MDKLVDSDIIPIWQPQGYSTYQITKDIAVKSGKKTTHTGVLDPMAEGVIIVLAGERRFDKSRFSDGTKKYEFDLTFGLSTDSYDGMGLVTQIDLSNQPSEAFLRAILPEFLGEYAQTVPLYSAQKVEGKKLFMYPRLGLPAPDLPQKKGTIYAVNLIDYHEVSLNTLIEEVIVKIKNIRLGEFRQDAIYKGWNDLLINNDLKNNVIQATISVETSRGLYVRSLSQDICYKLGVSGFVSRLVRTQNGDYTKSDCCTLDQFC